MGFDSALNTVARVAAPLGVGAVYARVGESAAFACAGGVVWFAAALTAVRAIMVARARQASLTAGRSSWGPAQGTAV